MKRRIIGISVILLLLVLWVVRVAIVSDKYTLPEIKQIKIGETFTAEGLTYRYESMDMYDYEGIMKTYNLKAEEMMFSETLDTYEKKYYVMKYTITAEEDDYQFNENNFGYINRYSYGYHHELPFMYALNGGGLMKIKKGESATYYLVISLVDYDYTEETFDKISLEDMMVYFYDMQTAIEYRMEAR